MADSRASVADGARNCTESPVGRTHGMAKGAKSMGDNSSSGSKCVAEVTAETGREPGLGVALPPTSLRRSATGKPRRMT